MNNTQTIKTELWNNHKIRFVWNKSEWWAVAVDICKALSIKNARKAVSDLPDAGVTTSYIGVETGTKRNGESAKQEILVNIINEQNVYRLIFKSRKPEAEQFQDWVYILLKDLRQASGLEGFQIFRMLDKEHQKEAMTKLKEGLRKPGQIDFIKANTITNKAISSMFGYPKMIKKGEMTPEMLVHREPVLEDTVELMSVVDKFGLDCTVSEKIRERYH